MKNENLNLFHERIDDIPLVLGIMQSLGVPEIIDKEIGNHGNHEGWSNGELALIWLSYIISEGDHRKSFVQDWANRHRFCLEKCVGKGFRDVEFTDDRLGILLNRVNDKTSWEAIESGLWSKSVLVYELEMTHVRLDSTTSYGYHKIEADGIMQLGHSKDHRSDLPQLKLMAASADPYGHWLGSEVYAGNRADDGLYIPMIDRVGKLLKKNGLLYIGDSKMGSSQTRASLVVQGNYYLTPLAKVGKNDEAIAQWVKEIVDGDIAAATLLFKEGAEAEEDAVLIGAGYETDRLQTALFKGDEVTWHERVFVIRSIELAKKQSQSLESRLKKGEEALLKLVPGKGRKVYESEAALQEDIEKILAQYKVKGLLTCQIHKNELLRKVHQSPGRPGKNAKKIEKRVIRYQVKGVLREKKAIADRKRYLGWRVLVSNAEPDRLPFPQAYPLFRKGWVIERSFHLIKDKPIGISPLHVRNDEQIRGLTYFLTIALRIISLMEIQIRKGIAKSQVPIKGLYPGLPKKETMRPTIKRILQAIIRTEITLTRIQIGNQQQWHLTPLPQWIKDVLSYLNLNESVYYKLAEN